MKEIFTTFKDYCGTGIYPLLFLAALVWLFFTEKRKKNRWILLETSAVILLLFFCPLFRFGMEKLGEGETYYRILWLLPMSIVIACAGVKLIWRHRKIGLVIMAAILILSGDYVYNNVYITKAQNRYHLPDSVIVICDAIHPAEDEERVTAAFPVELLHYVRQYDTYIQMPYGRESLVSTWGTKPTPLFETMEAPSVNVKRLAELSAEAVCHYVVVNGDKPLEGNPEEFGLKKVAEADVYDVYRNEAVPILKKDR